MNKKAQGHNYLAVVVLIFSFAIMSILTLTIWMYVVDALTVAGYNAGEVAVAIDAWTRAFRMADYVTVLLLVIMIIATALTSTQIATNSAYFIMTFIFGIFWAYLAYFFNYVFIQFVSQPVFSTTMAYFPRTMAICTNLHWVTLLLIVVGSLTLYGKKSQGQYLT